MKMTKAQKEFVDTCTYDREEVEIKVKEITNIRDAAINLKNLGVAILEAIPDADVHVNHDYIFNEDPCSLIPIDEKVWLKATTDGVDYYFYSKEGYYIINPDCDSEEIFKTIEDAVNKLKQLINKSNPK